MMGGEKQKHGRVDLGTIVLSLLSKPQVFAAPNYVKALYYLKATEGGQICVYGSCLQTGGLNTNSPMKSEEGMGRQILQVCKL